jgi:hypothetical protein
VTLPTLATLLEPLTATLCCEVLVLVCVFGVLVKTTCPFTTLPGQLAMGGLEEGPVDPASIVWPGIGTLSMVPANTHYFIYLVFVHLCIQYHNMPKINPHQLSILLTGTENKTNVTLALFIHHVLWSCRLNYV